MGGMSTLATLPEMSGHGVILLGIRFCKLPPTNVSGEVDHSALVDNNRLDFLVRTKSVQHSTHAN